MRYYFFDSSTFLKLFVVENGADRVRAIVRAAEANGAKLRVSVCDLAHPEVVSALRQMVERGVGGRRGISAASLKRTLPELRTFFEQSSAFSVVRASDVVAPAADLAARLQITGADSVHVAAAKSVQRRAKRG
ncbi:MAG: type II toxin-antitoxin system VapC family toxin [Gemmatimonadetes bacterium]|nr:type II toxin-antitoxin system VapC family toxin [Gemmatimonadota bacterium]